MTTVSDSITKSAATPTSAASTTYVITNQGEVEYLAGLLGGDSQYTRTFGSITGNYYSNNSIGIAAQESINAIGQFYLQKCDPALNVNRHFFSSVSAGFGGVNQRLYFTPNTTQSATIPLAAQGSYVFLAKDGDKKPTTPHAIISAQVGYTPFLNAPHDYQLYENANIIFPTTWKFLTIALTQSDYYANNAEALLQTYRDAREKYYVTAISKPFPTSRAGELKIEGDAMEGRIASLIKGGRADLAELKGIYIANFFLLSSAETRAGSLRSMLFRFLSKCLYVVPDSAS